jgi:hypothetical protein
MVKSFCYITCSEARLISTKSQYQEAKPGQFHKLLMHLKYCTKCRKFHCDNDALKNLLKKSKVRWCSKPEKDILKKRFYEQINLLQKKSLLDG